MGLILTKIKTLYNNFFDDGRLSEEEMIEELNRWRHKYSDQLMYDYASQYGGERIDTGRDYMDELR